MDELFLKRTLRSLHEPGKTPFVAGLGALFRRTLSRLCLLEMARVTGRWDWVAPQCLPLVLNIYIVSRRTSAPRIKEADGLAASKSGENLESLVAARAEQTTSTSSEEKMQTVTLQLIFDQLQEYAATQNETATEIERMRADVCAARLGS